MKKIKILSTDSVLKYRKYILVFTSDSWQRTPKALGVS